MTNRKAFTLIELLVVITIIVVLLALLAPALDKAVEQAQRVVCGANLKVISGAAVMYGFDNKKTLFIPRGRDVTVAFDPKGTKAHENSDTDDYLVDWPAALASVGLASAEKVDLDDSSIHGETPDDPLYKENVPGKMWDCPTRKGDFKTYWATSPLFVPTGYTLLTGYQYVGGLKYWKNPLGLGLHTNPPVARKTTDPGRRALITDVTASYERVWGGRPGPLLEGESWYMAGSPPHRDGTRENNYPDGQNQGYLDGSVEFVDADKLFMFHNWNWNPAERFYYWQEDFGGWSPGEDHPAWARNQ